MRAAAPLALGAAPLVLAAAPLALGLVLAAAQPLLACMNAMAEGSTGFQGGAFDLVIVGAAIGAIGLFFVQTTQRHVRVAVVLASAILPPGVGAASGILPPHITGLGVVGLAIVLALLAFAIFRPVKAPWDGYAEAGDDEQKVVAS